MALPALSYGADIWSPQLIDAGTHCAANRVQLSFLRQLLGVRQSTPALVLLAETGQLPLAARWVTQMGRFWNAVLAVDGDSLVRRDFTPEVGGAGVAQQPWAGQVAAALRAYGWSWT